MKIIKYGILLSVLITVVTTTVRSQLVYKTPSGAKYHLATCRMVKNVSEQITLQRALDMGLQPCKICKPVTSAFPVISAGKAKGEANTTRCRGLTRAGTRCKHMTGIANGYCFQHQPKE